jgi:hypothetical protein
MLERPLLSCRSPVPCLVVGRQRLDSIAGLCVGPLEPTLFFSFQSKLQQVEKDASQARAALALL